MVQPRPTPSPAPAAARFRCADGIELATETWAGGARGPVIFAHGFGQTRAAWTTTAQTAAGAGWTCITYDARGHGDSDWLADGHYAVEQFIDDQRQLCAACDTPPIIVGASMGGLVGIAVSGADVAACRALVLVDVTPRWEAAGVERILAFMRAHPDGFADFDAAADAIAAYLPHRRTRKSPQQLQRLLRNGADGRLRWHWDPTMLRPVAEESARHQADLLDAARRIRVPTLLISGAESDVVSTDTIDEFLGLVPHARHVSVAKATHMVAGDENSQFSRHVLDFLADVEGV